MSCVLRITGSDFDVDKFMIEAKFEASDNITVSKKGEFINALKKRKRIHNGIGVIVSNAPFLNFEKQEADAIAYLNKYKSAFIKLKNYDIDGWRGLDFGVDTFPENRFYREYILSIELIKLCAECGLEIYMSNYFSRKEKRRKKRVGRLFKKKKSFSR
ncbi:hypothetical protein CAP35_12740 [Chitinophagaceae bacterium IBVUCB1]|nr:hypothetical protein CAP35_12740 [Chitinophagaceae bacterium IBVUCB1]